MGPKMEVAATSEEREQEMTSEELQQSHRKNSVLGVQSLLSFLILFSAWLVGFSSRLFAVVRFESIIHEFDPWYVRTKKDFLLD